MTPFFHVQLRTMDVDAARRFYAAMLGERVLDIVQLHERAVARGAPSHWLGYLDVGDVERAAAAFTRRGATALGPKWVNPEGLEAAVMRDPGGAIVALAKPPARMALRTGADVTRYELNTADVEGAKVTYGELFGWAFETPVDLGALGVLHPFAWERGGPIVGSMSDIGARPGVHAHWLFHLRVAALDAAVEAVRASGGKVLGPIDLPTGERIAVCDDPQGAAFALREAR
jgi:predicted enzyme related to lactoylglutathione lyase